MIIGFCQGWPDNSMKERIVFATNGVKTTGYLQAKERCCICLYWNYQIYAHPWDAETGILKSSHEGVSIPVKEFYTRKSPIALLLSDNSLA